MADQLSQNDLNALLGLTAEEGASGPREPAEDTAPAAGISQGDLDSLLAGLADFAPAARPKGPAPVQQDCAAVSGKTLSQDEIDQLLTDFGK
jgi:flagellar motor switch protein FliM